MFERIGRLAEKTADGLSRRSFLTRMGLGALAVATFVTGARAGPTIQCVLNGGCCGGSVWKYQKIVDGVSRGCCRKARCTDIPAACAAYTTCCNGGGACLGGHTCYKDTGCNNPC
jgi:hypothetical protein